MDVPLQILALIVLCAGLVLSLNIDSSSTPLCSLDEDSLRRELRQCVRKGDRFIRKYFNALSKKKGRTGCSLFGDAHECFRDLFSKCSASRKRLSPDWLAVYDVMDCQCSNKSEDCVTAVPCFEMEHKSILSLRCDDYLDFNKRQKTRHQCHFIHENIQCKEALVSTACGNYSGMFAFHLYKYKEQKSLSKTHHCPHLHRHSPYNGFHYSENCQPNFIDDLFLCEDILLHREVYQAFHTANDLVFAHDAEALHDACSAYRKYEECRKPIKEGCPQGVKILEDYDGQTRTMRMKLKFICEEKKNQYIENLPCYNTVIENGTLKVCNEKFEALKPIMNSVVAHQFYCQRSSDGTQQLLGALDELRICYEETFVGACGTDGGTVMSGLMTEAFRDPLYLRYSYEPDCSLHTPDENDLIDNHTDTKPSSGYQENNEDFSEEDASDNPYDNDTFTTDHTYHSTRHQTKNPSKDYIKNEVLDTPQVGQPLSSPSGQQKTNFHASVVALTILTAFLLFPT